MSEQWLAGSFCSFTPLEVAALFRVPSLLEFQDFQLARTIEICERVLRTEFVSYFSVTVIVIVTVIVNALCNVYPVALDSTRR